MRLSRTVAYGVYATLQLAQSESKTPVPCSRLAAAGNMPERFLLQILRNLVHHGILHSTRGVDGGFMLGRGPHDISLLEVIEAIDGPLEAGLPDVTGGSAPTHQQHLRHALERSAQAARDQLAAVTLADLCGPKVYVARTA